MDGFYTDFHLITVITIEIIQWTNFYKQMY